jgi:hypothetical protein
VELQISTPVKLVAILGLVLAIAGGGGLTLLGRGGEAEAGVIAPQLLPLPKKAKEVVTKANAATGAKAAKPAAKPKRAAAAPKFKPKPAAPKPEVVTDSGLPAPIATALASKGVVVVALFSPGSTIDELALAEAQAGAKAAKVGFVAVNVLREGQGRAMARLLGVTDSPTLLVYRAPGTLTFRLDGFADLDTVAQAALDAPRGAGA